MRSVERLGAGVRFRLVAEQPTADSYWDPCVSKKLARPNLHFLLHWAPREGRGSASEESISRMCASTHMVHYLKLKVVDLRKVKKRSLILVDLDPGSV